jgi:uncharacterized protein YdaL
MTLHRRRLSARRPIAVAAAAMLAGSLLALTPASATAPDSLLDTGLFTASLPAPPPPPSGQPKQWSGYQAPTALLSATLQTATTLLSTLLPTGTSSGLVTWGAPGAAKTLVVYDTTDTWGWLGELYAMAAGNLASHFGTVTAEPVASYVAGQMNDYTSTIYIGSTYNEPIPVAFLNDVLATTHPVIWAADNVWQLSGTDGSDANLAFEAKYGWDPSTSYFDTTDNVTAVGYKTQTFSRSAANGANILAPHITNPAAVRVLGQANCTDASGAAVPCAPIAQATGTTFPWAIRSANLTYVGEVPFSYISETDRYIVFSDLLFAALAPAAQPTHQALVRLEDVNPTADPTALRQFADYLSGQHVPFTVGVIPQYTDPNGAANGGIPQVITLAQAPAVVSALKYMQSKGGVIIQHGYTHQYSNVANPYNAVTGDDAEFYRARCSTTQSAPYNFEVPCQSTDWVIWTGPLPNDSRTGAAARVLAGRQLFTLAGLSAPAIFEVPHYFASPADYAGIGSVFSTRYERELFVSGQLTGQPYDFTRSFSQFFPYVIHDVYGAKIIPENLGNYEPEMSNNVPPRLPQDIIHNAQLNLAVTQGVASFFYHPDLPLAGLQQTVTGIRDLGYTFVAANTLGG